MSIQAIQWALFLPCNSSTCKVVLIGLANHADPLGGACYPSITRLQLYTGLHRTSIIKAIGKLEVLGVISAVHVRGKKTRYTLHLDADQVAQSRQLGGREIGVPQSPRPPGRAVLLHPSRSATGASSVPLPKPSLTVHKPSEGRERAMRLPSEWQLPAAWREWAKEHGMDTLAIEREAEIFKDYWHSVPYEKALKTSWFKTWCNWCRREMKNRRWQSSSGRSTMMEAVLGGIDVQRR